MPTTAPIDLWFSDFPDPDRLGPSAILVTTGLTRRAGTFREDLLTRRVRIVTARPLDPQLTYRVTVTTALRSLAGCAPAEETQYTFRTGTAAGPALPVPTGSFPAVAAVFARSCASGACHGEPPPGGRAAGGLRLDGLAREALIGVPSTAVAGMLRVAPGDAARSYLLRKLVPRDGPGGPLPGVAGARMPPGPPLSDGDLRIISDWIDSGAGAE